MQTAVIIDDEIKSAQNLELLLGQVRDELKVTVLGLAHNALEGIKLIREKKPGIIFLDIHMPGNSGFDVAEHLEEPLPQLVFVTAHKEYVVKALRAGANDYLLKPVDVEDLEECLQRLEERRQLSFLPQGEAADSANNAVISIPVKDGCLFIRRDELVRVEASGSYAFLYLDEGVKHMVSKSIGELGKLIGEDPRFFRCHNSHIVNLGKVKRFINTEGYFVQMSDDSKVEVSRRLKDEFMEAIARQGEN
ncbi:MAG: two-component system, LytT family, response regulator [Bacteroidetes bacterium]|nr:MAG: two-component system, LytT family, response regulator [Bacteroidota bacterium]